MTAYARLAEGARRGLELVADSFRLFTIPDVNPPSEPTEWSDFLRQNPQYVDHKQWATTYTIAEDRTVLEAMSEDYQRLGGTLIRVMFSDKELIQMHNETNLV